MQDFVGVLSERLGALESEVREKLNTSTGYASLAEQALFSAVRTASSRKRRDLAELLRTGLEKSETELVQHETLLRLRDQLNDPQVLILYSYGAFEGGFRDAEQIEFLEQHPEVFDVEPANFGSDASVQKRATIHETYVKQLVALGLIADVEPIGRSSMLRTEITDLGRMLLEAIGVEVKG